MFKFKFLLVIFLMGVLVFPTPSFGLMNSNDYTIFADSIDSGGGLSTGGIYNLQDTIGESPVGSIIDGSESYEILGGYQAMDFSFASIDLSDGNINFGNLVVGVVASSSILATVSTNASGGYVMQVGSSGASPLAGVSDGTVTAGQEEYGIAVSGVDATFADDRAIVSNLSLAVSSTPVTAVATTITFKASISNASVAGARSQAVTLSVFTNL